MRLIDVDKAIEDMQYYHDDCAKTSVYTRLGFKTAIEVVKDAPTVEVIPKADYEARLKADLVAILTELHLKMEEIGDDLSTEDWVYGYKSGVEDMIQLLDERIDKLKGESDAQEQKKE